MSWKSVTTHSLFVRNELVQAFERFFKLGGAPKGSALFESNEPGQKTYVLYFSPDAANVMSDRLSMNRAVECDAPRKGTVAFLIGHASDREELLR